MARTDAIAVEGIGPAIERAVACVEAGADMIFPEAIYTLEQYREFKNAVKVPILANITEFGQTPLFTTDELQVRRRRHRALLLRRVSRDEQGRAEFLRDRAPRRHAEGRRADACRRARSSTISSATTPTSRSSMRCSPTARRTSSWTMPAGRERGAAQARDWDAMAAIVAALIGLLALRRFGLHRLCPAPAGARAGVAVAGGRQQRSRAFDRGAEQGRGSRDRAQRAGIRRRQAAADLGRTCSMRSACRSRISFQQSTINPNVLTPGERVTIIKFPDEDVWKHFRAEATNRVAMNICFCSTLGDCWMYSDRRPVGYKLTTQLVKPIDECPRLPDVGRLQQLKRRCRRAVAARRCRNWRIRNERQRATGAAQAQEIRRAVRRRRRQHGAVHGRPHRQRSALSRLRHPRCRDDLRVRGNRVPARARQAADARGARLATRRS